MGKSGGPWELKSLIQGDASVPKNSMASLIKAILSDKTGGVVFIWTDGVGSKKEINALEQAALDSKKRKRNIIFFMLVRLTLNMKEKDNIKKVKDAYKELQGHLNGK